MTTPEDLYHIGTTISKDTLEIKYKQRVDFGVQFSRQILSVDRRYQQSYFRHLIVGDPCCSLFVRPYSRVLLKTIIKQGLIFGCPCKPYIISAIDLAEKCPPPDPDVTASRAESRLRAAALIFRSNNEDWHLTRRSSVFLTWQQSADFPYTRLQSLRIAAVSSWKYRNP